VVPGPKGSWFRLSRWPDIWTVRAVFAIGPQLPLTVMVTIPEPSMVSFVRSAESCTLVPSVQGPLVTCPVHWIWRCASETDPAQFPASTAGRKPNGSWVRMKAVVSSVAVMLLVVILDRWL